MHRMLIPILLITLTGCGKDRDGIETRGDQVGILMGTYAAEMRRSAQEKYGADGKIEYVVLSSNLKDTDNALHPKVWEVVTRMSISAANNQFRRESESRYHLALVDDKIEAIAGWSRITTARDVDGNIDPAVTLGIEKRADVQAVNAVIGLMQ